jgi:Transposase DDE domain
LGLLSLDAWPSPVTTTKVAKQSTEQRRKDDNRSSKRWLKQSLQDEALGSGVTLIHVEDREADIYACMEARLAASMHFIVRAQSYRKVVVENEVENILEHMRARPRLLRRQAVLSRRQVNPGLKSSHQSRDGRQVTLAIAAAPVVVRRSRKDNATVAASLTLNAVHVIEVDVPEGEDPVEWLLLTTEPVDTEADIEFVVDSYRARWVIEEYFKALKTGCAYEARQLESYDALLNALSIYAVIAWQLLWMRFAAQHETAVPRSSVVSADELAVLVAQGRVGEDPTVNDVMRGIAKLGGHLKWNGEPGWEVLWRGFRTLRLLASGFALGASRAGKRSDQW